MGIAIASLLLSAAVLLALLYVVVLRSPWGWPVRIGALAAVALLAAGAVRAYPPLLGWPTAIDLPTRFSLVGTHIVEPQKGSSAPGHIFLWVTDLEAMNEPVPRAYDLRFDPDLHARVVIASQKLRKGLPQMGEVVPAPPGTDGAAHATGTTLEFYDMPDPLFPER